MFCNPRTRLHFPDTAEWNLLAVELHTHTCTKLSSKYSRNLFQVFGVGGKLQLALDGSVTWIIEAAQQLLQLAGGISVSGAEIGQGSQLDKNFNLSVLKVENVICLCLQNHTFPNYINGGEKAGKGDN